MPYVRSAYRGFRVIRSRWSAMFVAMMFALPGLLQIGMCLASETGRDNVPLQSESIHEVHERHVDGLMAIPGVVGVGIGECDGAPCIKVFVAEMTSAIATQIPARLDGYHVAIEETGDFRPLGPSK